MHIRQSLVQTFPRVSPPAVAGQQASRPGRSVRYLVALLLGLVASFSVLPSTTTLVPIA
jgi:hypothetical protein